MDMAQTRTATHTAEEITMGAVAIMEVVGIGTTTTVKLAITTATTTGHHTHLLVEILDLREHQTLHRTTQLNMLSTMVKARIHMLPMEDIRTTWPITSTMLNNKHSRDKTQPLLFLQGVSPQTAVQVLLRLHLRRTLAAPLHRRLEAPATMVLCPLLLVCEASLLKPWHDPDQRLSALASFGLDQESLHTTTVE